MQPWRSSFPWLGWIRFFLFGSVLLYLGQPLFVPLSFALLISFVLYPVCHWLEGKGMSRMGAIIVGITLLGVVVGALAALLVSQAFSFVHEWPAFRTNLLQVHNGLSAWLLDQGVGLEQQRIMMDRMLNKAGDSAGPWIADLISVSTVSVVLVILVPVYVFLILLYRHRLVDVLVHIFPTQGSDNIREILNLSIRSYYNFVKGMLIVYLIVGVLNSLGLWLLGIPSPVLFGFVASILTIIPYIGILIASLLPVAIAWITFQSMWYPLGVLAIFASVQYLEANIIFPWAVSSRLKINMLATVVVIIAGGIIWGAAGMILFIPFLSILKLIADRTASLKTLSILLGVDDP
ncbi:MAG TPA: AI-2E family transporter [Cytophagales bacterium]|nr:AI-2E family transporter [Cytophagales bacterium]